ncbi:MAG TPA: TIGR03621 family F420-dependent LLM class oxidoreductase [Candidatus Dormibacteraeota bacterium]|nr:TIGR03621 family F420-dependent LLM class oxidoreductase [Candidatus Dormibacteraeota bacterium]
MHPFRFGVTASWAASADEWTGLARRAESLGYATLLIADHLGRQLSPMPALTAAALATTRLRVGSYVFANDYRHPLMLATEAATLDILSGGRLELGLGAGWNQRDYRMLGYPYEAPGRRIDRLEESLPLIARLLAGETVDHEGPRYAMRGAVLSARPVQSPRPPIMVGGGGPRLLRIAAREADIVAMQPQFDPQGRPMIRQGTEGATERKVAIVREAAGGRFERLELNVVLGDAGLVGNGAPLSASLLAAAKAVATGVLASPYVLYGTVDGIRQQLLRRRDHLGISYYVLPRRTMETMAPIVDALTGR